ncbi:MAG: aldehyde dehydrogenase family protein [Nitrospinota bacterium]|nr:aldehyde dehydrogenase family protein [Nitrospinota bacterium]
MAKRYKLFIGGKWISSRETMPVIDPFNGQTVATVAMAGQAEMERAVMAAEKAFETTKSMSSYATATILRKAAAGIEKSRKRLVEAIVSEAGKPVTLAENEVDRSITTFTVAAEEASRIGGQWLPVDIDTNSGGRIALTKRFPVGVVAGISPFNFPLNLVAHKVAPAIASRNCIVLKPASKTPISALILGEILEAAGVTPGQYNVVPCSREVGEALATDPRVAKLTFTGSPAVGWRLMKLASGKKVTLELGGNAASVIHSDADLDWAVARSAKGAYVYAGQTCICVQRILIHKPVYSKVVKALINEIKEKIRTGDPRRKDVLAGPMINDAALAQTKEWVAQAVAGGARILAGGKAQGPCFQPTLLENVKRDMNVVCREVFAPVAVVQSYSDFDEALDMVNDSEYGLQVGVFTSGLKEAFSAFEKARVGGVIINDFPTFRVDNMPYGGVKLSGFGREGVRWAIEEMTEIKVMVIKP